MLCSVKILLKEIGIRVQRVGSQSRLNIQLHEEFPRNHEIPGDVGRWARFTVFLARKVVLNLHGLLHGSDRHESRSQF